MATKKQAATARIKRTKASITSAPAVDFGTQFEQPGPVEDAATLAMTTTELRIAEQAKLTALGKRAVATGIAEILQGTATAESVLADDDVATVLGGRLPKVIAKAVKAATPKVAKATKLCHKCGENPRHTQPGGATLSLCFPCFKTYHLEYSAARKAKKAAEA
jgi:hypothetical protein